MKDIIKLSKIVCPLLFLILYSSCTTLDDGDSAGGKVTQEVSVSFTMDLSIDDEVLPDARSMTRADYEKEGTADESVVKNLVLFIIPLADDLTEIRNSAEPENQIITIIDHSPPVPTAEGIITTTFSARIPTGLKHIYVGANMDNDMIARFVGVDRFSNLADENKLVTKPIVDTDDIGLKGISMLGQLNIGASSVIDITPGNLDFTGNQIDLKRMVAKVLTLCKTEDRDGLPSAFPSDHGWIAPDSIYFCLVNTATEFTWATGPMPGAPLGPLLRVINGLKDENGGINSNWMGTPVWDSSKIGPDISPADHYNEGIFCLENSAGTATSQTATQVLVAAKFLPGEIMDVDASNRLTSVICSTRQQALSLLTTPDYQEGTFWVKDNQYYSLKGRIAAGNQGFTRYTGGWGYYYTLIDGDIEANGILGWGEIASCIHRNNYYILTVKELMVPGISEILPPVGDPTIKVNMQIVNWVSKGGGDLNVDLSEED